MTPTKTVAKAKPNSATRAGRAAKASKGFSAEEKAAARARIQELKAEAGQGGRGT